MDRLIRGRIPVPPPNPPWLANRTGGTEFYDISDSDAESSVHSDSSYDDPSEDGPPLSVPSWAKSS